MWLEEFEIMTFDWNVLDQIYSFYLVLDVNWHTPVLAMGSAFLTVHESLVLVVGCFLLSLLAALLISYSTMPGSILITTQVMFLLADGQVTAAAVLEGTSWSSSVDSSQRDCDLRVRPYETGTPWGG